MKTSPIRFLPLLIVAAALLLNPALSHAEDTAAEASQKEEVVKEKITEETPAPNETQAKKITPEKKPEKEERKEEKEKTKPKPEEKKPEPQVFPPLSEGDAEDIETTGLLRSVRDGSLGKDMWRGSKRSTLITLLEELQPPPAQYPAMHRLYKGILLSRADAGLINNDIEIEHGHDLLTLRLKKLLEFGMVNKAAKLYAALDDEPYSAKLAELGILAYLLNGESSLACLELQIAKDTLKKENSAAKFLTNINSYCEAVLDEELPEAVKDAINNSSNPVFKKALLDEDYTYTYEIQPYSRLSLFTKATLNALGKLDIDKLPEIEGIPAHDLVILFRHPKASFDLKLKLAGEALKRGVMDVEDLTDFYDSIILPTTGNDKDEAALKSHEKLVLYYKQAGRTRGEERRDYIDKAMAMEGKYGLYALAPFATHMRYEDWGSADFDQLSRIVTLLHATQQAIPSDFFEWLDAKRETKKTPKNFDSSYLAAFLSASPRMKEEKKDIINSIIENHNSKSKVFLKNIMKTIDSDMVNNNNANKVYENDFDLTLFIDYVMPSHNVWRRFIIANQAKLIAETSLWSTYVFRGKQPEEIYPGLWRDVLHGLDAVGLNEISDELAVSALLAEQL
jgi:hypothetical protein